MNKISIAEVKRFFKSNIGRKCFLTNCTLGPCHKERIIHEVRSNDVLLKTERGTISFLTFRKGDTAEMGPDCLRIYEAGGELAAEYSRFEEAIPG